MRLSRFEKRRGSAQESFVDRKEFSLEADIDVDSLRAVYQRATLQLAFEQSCVFRMAHSSCRRDMEEASILSCSVRAVLDRQKSSGCSFDEVEIGW